MIRNRYNNLTPSVQDTKGKKTHLKQRHHIQNTTSRKPRGEFLPKKNSQTAIQNKKKVKERVNENQ